MAFWPPRAVMALDIPPGESGAAFDAATRQVARVSTRQVARVSTRRVARVSTRRGMASPRVVLSNGKKSAQRKASSRRSLIQFATWNVRSLINVNGPVETAFV